MRQAQKKNVCKKTEKMLEKIKTARYEELFELLDSDKDGKIAPNNMSAHKIMDMDVQVLKLMKPIFEKMEIENLTLDMTKFTEEMNQLLTTNFVNYLDIIDR